MVPRIINMWTALLFLLQDSFFYHGNVPFAFCTESASSFVESHEGRKQNISNFRKTRILNIFIHINMPQNSSGRGLRNPARWKLVT